MVTYKYTVSPPFLRLPGTSAASKGKQEVNPNGLEENEIKIGHRIRSFAHTTSVHKNVKYLITSGFAGEVKPKNFGL